METQSQQQSTVPNVPSLPQNVLEAIKLNPQGYDLGNEAVKTTQDNIPDPNDPNVKQSMYLNRCTQPVRPNQIFKSALQRERLELKRMFDDLGYSPTDWVCYVPNAKMGWFNATMKQGVRNMRDRGLQKPTITICDKQMIQNLWMNNTAKNSMMRFIDTYYDTAPTGSWGYAQPPSKGPRLQCINNKIGIDFKNPGFVFSEEAESCNLQPGRKGCECDVDKEAITACHDLDTALCKYQKICQQQDEEPHDTDMIEPGFLKWLTMLKAELCKNISSFGHIKHLLRTYKMVYDLTSMNYLHSILKPEESLSARIPVDVPVPSCPIHLKTNVTITTNAAGNASWFFAPSYLTNGAQASFAVNTDPTLIGIAANNNYEIIPVGQQLPAPLYSK